MPTSSAWVDPGKVEDMAMKRILALVLTLALLLGAAPVHATETEKASTMVVTGGWLRLRAEPAFDAETIGSYMTGTEVTVLAIVNEWYQVRTPDGLTGYMYGDYLVKPVSGTTGGGGSSATEDPGPAPQQATVVSSNGMGVKLRTGPSTGYGVIMVVPVGTVVTILLEGDQWHYIRVGDKMGYMMAQFLSTGADVQPGGYLARITSPNGYGVRLRSGPGTGYDVIGFYSVGTEVTVLEYGATWCKIRVGSRVGYMMTQFLTTSQVVATVQSVKLNITAPDMGDVLTAIVTPAYATVTYRWTDGNGTLLSTAPSYAVTAADVGRRIRVTVTGTGMYSGSAKSSLTSAVSYNAALTGVYLDNTAPTVGQTVTATVQPEGATASYAWYRSDGSYLGSGSKYRVTGSDVGYMIYCKATGTGAYTGTVYSSYTGMVVYTATTIALNGTISLPSTAEAGEKITANVYLNAPSSSVTYVWTVGNQEITGVNGKSLTLDSSMVGRKVKVKAVALSGSGYTGTVTSNACTVEAAYVAPTQLTGTVEIPYSAYAGEVITADLYLNSAAVTYQWYLNGSKISGATGHQLTLNNAMAGGSVYVVVKADDSEFTGSVTSNVCSVQGTYSEPPASRTDLIFHTR